MNVVQMMTPKGEKFAPFKAALFDLDGTLVDTAPDLAEALNHCLAAEGHAPFAVEDMRSLVGHGAVALLKRGFALREGKPLEENRIAGLRELFLAYYSANICVQSRPFEGVEAVLDSLAEAEVRCGICTNKPHDMAVQLIDTLGWTDRFDAIVGGDLLDFKKPDPRHVTALLDQMNCAGQPSIFIGDSDADYQAARAAGLPTIIVRFGYSAHPLESYSEAAILDHYDEFERVVAQL